MSLDQASSHWREVRLGDLGVVGRGRSRHRPRYAPELYGGPYPFVQTGDIKASGGRITSHSQTYSEYGLAQSRLWPANTMVITIAANIAETAILTYPSCFPDSVVGFIADESKCDVRFVEYNFRVLRAKIQQENVGTGSVQDNINLQTLDELRFPLPPLPEQRAIAHILGTLDDKIALNWRMNQTLEEMARAIFQDWFVDFGPVRAKLEGREPYLPSEPWDLFPDRLVESELGEIPVGWEMKTLGEVVTQLRDSVNPSKSPDVFFSHFSIPAYDGGRIPKKQSGESIKSSKSQVQPGVVLLSKLNPEIERVWLVDVASDERAICSTEFLVLSPRLPFLRSYVYCFVRSPMFREQIQAIVTGTSRSHQRAQASTLLSMPAIIPSEQAICAFGQQAEVFLSKSLALRRETTVLDVQRDALLPQLVSGEFRFGKELIHGERK